MVNLKDATRPPPPATFVCHGWIWGTPTRRVCARVVGDGARKNDWGRQLGGVVGVCRRRAPGDSLLVALGGSDNQTGMGLD